MGSDGDDAVWRPAGARFEGTWTAGKVARHLGIAESTLRSWHRRYGVGPHGRQPGRHRRYGARDVARLERMRDLIAAGVLPSDAARAVRRPAGAWAPATDLLSALVAAAGRLDSQRCLTLLRRGLLATDVATVWERLCRPALRAVDADQAENGRCPDSEHVLSWAVQAALAGATVSGLAPVVRRRRPGGREPQVLLACVAGERHTLPLEALAAVLTERGFGVRMLGADTPTEAITRAVSVSGPAAVVVWSQYGEGAASPGRVRDEVTEAARNRRSRLVTAGPGWAIAPTAPTASGRDEVTHVGSLAEAVAALARITGTTTGG